jgi:hypothetical protein
MTILPETTKKACEKFGREAYAAGKMAPAQDLPFLLWVQCQVGKDAKIGASVPYVKAWSLGFQAAHREASNAELAKIGWG